MRQHIVTMLFEEHCERIGAYRTHREAMKAAETAARDYQREANRSECVHRNLKTRIGGYRVVSTNSQGFELSIADFIVDTF